ncbi:hypothetical protein BZA77DRAFT_315590 [Pyronema omphalodes]|nr:hypothetical protein BZA77DRAFT_315590 [Pyronema omphalodes]
MESLSNHQPTGRKVGDTQLVNTDDRARLDNYALHENFLSTLNTTSDIENEYKTLREIICKALFKIEPGDQSESVDYLHYYMKECLNETTKDGTSLPPNMNRHGHLIASIELLYDSCHLTRMQIRERLEEFDEYEIYKEKDDSIKNFAIAFCLRVWLMTNVRELGDINVIPTISFLFWDDDHTTLKEFLDRALFSKHEKLQASTAAEDIPADFTVLNIQKYGKIRFVFTNNLADHLAHESMEKSGDKIYVYIFPHVFFLQKNIAGKFPDILNRELLEETLYTLGLLFRTPDDFNSIQARGENKTDWTDILDEIYKYKKERNDITGYSYYGARLEKINVLFAESKLDILPPFIRRKFHEKMPKQRSNESTPAVTDTQSGWKIKGPPRLLVLSRLTKSWLPKLTYGYRSRMKRHYTECPRLTSVTAFDSRGESRFGYLLVALFDYHGTAKEMIIHFEREDVSEKELFSKIRRCYEKLYSWKRYIHLKSLSGFKLYCCQGPNFEIHTRPSDSKNNDNADIALAQLFKVYNHSRTWLQHKPNVRTAWVVWIDQNLNGGSKRDPSRSGDCRTLGLELVIEWSGTRIVVFTAILILFSLIFGIMYGEMTPNHDRQTSWGIASYIVTVTGVIAAILAILRLKNTSVPGASETNFITKNSTNTGNFADSRPTNFSTAPNRCSTIPAQQEITGGAPAPISVTENQVLNPNPKHNDVPGPSFPYSNSGSTLSEIVSESSPIPATDQYAGVSRGPAGPENC